MWPLTGVDIISKYAYELLLAVSTTDVTFNAYVSIPLLISSDLAGTWEACLSSCSIMVMRGPTSGDFGALGTLHRF